MRSLRGGLCLKTLTEDGEACVNIAPQIDASNTRSTRCTRNWRSLDPVWKEAMFERSFADKFQLAFVLLALHRSIVYSMF